MENDRTSHRHPSFPTRIKALQILPNHHERRFAPEHESLAKMVHAVAGGRGTDARSTNVWWLDPVA